MQNAEPEKAREIDLTRQQFRCAVHTRGGMLQRRSVAECVIDKDKWRSVSSGKVGDIYFGNRISGGARLSCNFGCRFWILAERDSPNIRARLDSRGPSTRTYRNIAGLGYNGQINPFLGLFRGARQSVRGLSTRVSWFPHPRDSVSGTERIIWPIEQAGPGNNSDPFGECTHLHHNNSWYPWIQDKCFVFMRNRFYVGC